VDYVTVERGPYDLQEPIAAHTIVALCRRAFGCGAIVRAIHEIGGGEINNTYRVRLEGHEDVILRVAPPPGAPLFWHEEHLMRREYSIQPYLAPIAPFAPAILMADFTHQLIDRDYMFQAFVPGERWSDVEGDLTPADDEVLWRQLARIVRAIHNVPGATFGRPDPGARVASWSTAVLYALEHTMAAAEAWQVDVAPLRAILDLARAHAVLFDEVVQPRLLHGDLWLVNVLIRRGADGPAVVGVLDADRASWGDPLSDWTIHLLDRLSSPRGQRNRAIFWEEYGLRPTGPSVRFRTHVYNGLHAGGVLTWATRHARPEVVAEAHAALHAISTTLAQMSRDGLGGAPR
jgi:aminoglycoside phosphotransferase (APT) family kinase protein